MRRFNVYRPNPPDNYVKDGYANPTDQIQCQGVVFDDGTVAVRWLTATGSTSIWDSFEDFRKIHGHPEYGTVIKWLDDPPIKLKQRVVMSGLQSNGMELPHEVLQKAWDTFKTKGDMTVYLNGDKTKPVGRIVLEESGIDEKGLTITANVNKTPMSTLMIQGAILPVGKQLKTFKLFGVGLAEQGPRGFEEDDKE